MRCGKDSKLLDEGVLPAKRKKANPLFEKGKVQIEDARNLQKE